jgi:hypothetical protein
MLNAALVEQLGSIHRNQKSGVLTVVGNGFRLRFCIQDGDPVALDFCADKELLLARALLDFHKIGPELYQLVVGAREAGKDTVTGMVRRHQAANEDEIGVVTRSMVEDTLVRAFGTMHYEMRFDESEGIDTFDFDTTAVRLRIGAPVLLSTVQSRVAEMDKVIKEIGGGNAVFTLAESEATVPLSEYEKHVLNFIDGHRSVEDIAIAFRENTLNMSRLIGTLVSKGVVRRSSGSGTRLQEPAIKAGVPASTPDHGLAAAGTSASPAPAPAPAPRPASAPRRLSMGTVLALGAAVMLILVVMVLMAQWRGRNAALASASHALDTHIMTKHWDEALSQIAESKRSAGNDLVALRQVADLQARLDAAFKVEHDAIVSLITNQEFTAAHARIAKLPIDGDVAELRLRVQGAEAAFKSAADELRDRVSKQLDDGRPTDARAAIAAANGRIGAAAGEYLDRWRLQTLERASSATAPLSQRAAFIEQLKASNPTQHQLDQIARIVGEFATLQQRSADQILNLKGRVEKGAFEEVSSEFERLRLGDQTRGTPLAAQTEALRVGNDHMRVQLTGEYDDAMALVRSSDEGPAMLSAAAAIQKTLEQYPLASNATQLRLANQLLADAAGLIGERTASDEALALDGWLQDRQPAAEITEIIKQRAARLRAIEVAADDALSNGRAYIRESDWDQAGRTFEQLAARKEWQHTAAHATALHEIEDLKVARAKQQAWQEDLTRAMLSGDVAECYRIQQKMGLKYLPLLVMSAPAGASVWREGMQIGTTPCKLDIPAGERTALVLELRRAGFVTKSVPASQADAGWMLQVDLEREALARYELNMTITSPPTVLDGKVWIANRQSAVALVPGSKPERVMIDPNGLIDTGGQPLYAAPTAAGNAVFFGTREGIAIKRTSQGVERLPLNGRTDFAIAVFSSQLVQGRRLLIVAGMDGVLHASDERSADSAWNGISGETFAAPPRLLGDQLMVVRRNGRIEVYQADDGKLSAQFDLGAATIAVWETTDGLAGLTADFSWSSAMAAPVKEALPQQAAAGGEDVFITNDNHVFLRVQSGEAWKDLGRVDGKTSGQPRRWGNQAVLPMGNTLVVLGPHGFKVSSGSPFLAPALLGDRMVAVNGGGLVLFYAAP